MCADSQWVAIRTCLCVTRFTVFHYILSHQICIQCSCSDMLVVFKVQRHWSASMVLMGSVRFLVRQGNVLLYKAGMNSHPFAYLVFSHVWWWNATQVSFTLPCIQIHVCVCVGGWVCVCVCVGGWAGVCVCVSIKLLGVACVVFKVTCTFPVCCAIVCIF